MEIRFNGVVLFTKTTPVNLLFFSFFFETQSIDMHIIQTIRNLAL